MKILYVVQRYGENIVGGSEAACREFTENLVLRGHDVEVLTSCAQSYIDWADEYEPGTQELNGVIVHRLRVVEPRNPVLFEPIHNWIVNHPGSAPLFEQQRWTRLMGPELRGQRDWLLKNASRFDAVIFMTYLYSTTTSGLPTISGRVPTILQPTAHDELPAYVSLYQSVFRQADAFLFFTPEEQAVVKRLYQIEPEGAVIGMGMNLDLADGESSNAVAKWGLEPHSYLLYVGRLDSSKGIGELVRFFESYKSRNKNHVKLVLAGTGPMAIPGHADIITTGFIDEKDKRDLLAGSLALVQPSYFESFSIVLCEAWLQGRPALVQGGSEVLRGQAIRSGGALPYEGFAEFEASTNLLLGNASLAIQMGNDGFKYVRENYSWSHVLNQLEETIELAKTNFSHRRFCTMPLR